MLLVAMPYGATANDGEYFACGNQLMPVQQTEIEVRKEVLTISIGDDGYAHVDVDYRLYNRGGEKTILMGFESDAPSGWMPEVMNRGENPYIKNFSVVMNGRKLSCSSAFVRNDSTPYGRKQAVDVAALKGYHYIDGSFENDSASVPLVFANYFQAHFKRGLNTVKHRYKYKMSTSNGGHYSLYYKLSPAMRWANRQIDDFQLVIKISDSPKYFFVRGDIVEADPRPRIDGIGKIRRYHHPKNSWKHANNIKESRAFIRRGYVVFQAKNYKPQNELHIYSGANFAGTGRMALLDPALCYYDRSYINRYFDPKTGKLADVIEFEEKELCLNDCDKIPAGKRAFMRKVLRNLPYAQRGYVFKSPDLKEFFSRVWWYMPYSHYRPEDDPLSKMEQKWVEGLK